MTRPHSRVLRWFCLLCVAGATAFARVPAATAGSGGVDAVSRGLLAQLAFEPLALVVYKRQRALVLYEYGARVREYPIVLGARPSGHKRYEGDLRTPEGLYRIDAVRPHKRWRYFISLDYPNRSDREAYARNLGQGLIPRLGGRAAGIGGGIGIHGTDKPDKQEAAEDWTRGCVAMFNSDIDDLNARVHVGTPVLILPGGGSIADHLTRVIGSPRVQGAAAPR